MTDDFTSIISGHDASDFLHYRIDMHDRIIEVDSSWNSFAENNGGRSISKTSIIGNPIWLYIDGIESRMIYEMLHQRARKDQIQIIFPFRCDSPRLRRFMKLFIHPATEGELDFFSLTLKEEPRSYVPLLDTGLPRRDEFIIMCSWCKRVQISAGNWLEVEDAIVALNLFDMDIAIPKITHHICPDCKDRLVRLSSESV